MERLGFEDSCYKSFTYKNFAHACTSTNEEDDSFLLLIVHTLLGMILEIRMYISNCSWIFNQNYKTQTYSTTLCDSIHNLEQ